MAHPVPTRAVVLGAGLGGIASALRLRALGLEVTLLERHPDLGGRARSRCHDGYFFDMGPTVITAPELLDELYALFGRNRANAMPLIAVEPWYQLIDQHGARFNYGGTLEQQCAEIARFAAADVPGYLKLLAHAQKLYQKGYVELGAEPFSQFRDMLRAAPSLVRLRADKTVARLISEHIQHPSLRQFFSMHSLLVGGDPFRSSTIYTLIHALERASGVWFAKGGTGALVAALERLMREVGITICAGERVLEIETTQQRVSAVRTENARHPCEIVVSNIDPASCYLHLLPSARTRHSARSIAKRDYSFGLYVLYFGTNKQYPDVAHHTVLFGARYQALLRDIGAGVLADDPSLYLHRPSKTDAQMAPPGCDSFYVLAPVPHNGHGIDWQRAEPKLRALILQQLEDRLLPHLSAHLSVQFSVTPDYFEQELGSYLGAGFSLSPTLLQSAYFRFHNRCRDVRGLYFAGAGTHPGAGVPGVLSSAKVVEKLVRADWLLPQSAVA
jgi:phytoene desaturase